MSRGLVSQAKSCWNAQKHYQNIYAPLLHTSPHKHMMIKMLFFFPVLVLLLCLFPCRRPSASVSSECMTEHVQRIMPEQCEKLWGARRPRLSGPSLDIQTPKHTHTHTQERRQGLCRYRWVGYYRCFVHPRTKEEHR